ncbi:hypothetical protein IQ31_03946 [Sphingobacterium siyangense]|uniref:Uncharacterized protein n=1 Tax=Sphingobacterium siyangense TaxID=459529 RepID=A0A562MBE0_9SPHI|nr:hypothetical protein IQ31_03946 [Sphingobacterium siyangense]
MQYCFEAIIASYDNIDLKLLHLSGQIMSIKPHGNTTSSSWYLKHQNAKHFLITSCISIKVIRLVVLLAISPLSLSRSARFVR